MRLLPEQIDMGDEPRYEDDVHGPVAVHLVGDADSVRVGVVGGDIGPHPLSRLRCWWHHLDAAVAVAGTAVVVGVMVAEVVLDDCPVVMAVVGGEGNGCGSTPDHRHDGGQRCESFYVDCEHLILLFGVNCQVVKLLMACSIVGASASQRSGGAAPTITVVADRPETMQAISRYRWPLSVR